MKYAVVTTFHANGYRKYASRMIDTFLQNWPAEVDLSFTQKIVLSHRVRLTYTLETYML